MFAAQVVDDRSETDWPDTDKPSEGSEDIKEAEPELEDSNEQEVQSDPYNHLDNLDSSQFDSPPYEEDVGYVTPPEDDNSETEYIRMMQDDKTDQSISPLPYNHMDWKPCHNEICIRYEIAQWIPHDELEFTPQYSVTHP
jgi:hypothetical protein